MKEEQQNMKQKMPCKFSSNTFYSQTNGFWLICMYLCNQCIYVLSNYYCIVMLICIVYTLPYIFMNKLGNFGIYIKVITFRYKLLILILNTHYFCYNWQWRRTCFYFGWDLALGLTFYVHHCQQSLVLRPVSSVTYAPHHCSAQVKHIPW